MKYLKRFNESRIAFKDISGKEHVMEFKLKEKESLEDAKKRLVSEIRKFWSHKNENDELVIGFLDSNGEEYKSDKIKLKGKSMEDVKTKFFKTLKFTWLHIDEENIKSIKSNTKG